MQPTVWVVALGSTLGWASFDVIRKRLVQEISVGHLSLWICVAQLPFFGLWVLWAGPELPRLDYFPPAAASVVLNVLANLLFLSAMKRVPLSQGIPLLSFTPVFVALCSIPLLSEHLLARQWMGVLLVSGGALGLTFPSGRRASLGLALRSLFTNRGALYMLAVAALWGLTPIFDKMALDSAGVATHGLVLAFGGALGMGAVLAVQGELPALRLARGRLPLLALGGGVNVFALGLQMMAISVMVVSVFEAFKRAVGMLLAMWFGAWFFRESLSVIKVLSGGLMALGVCLVLY